MNELLRAISIFDVFEINFSEAKSSQRERW